MYNLVQEAQEAAREIIETMELSHLYSEERFEEVLVATTQAFKATLIEYRIQRRTRIEKLNRICNGFFYGR